MRAYSHINCDCSDGVLKRGAKLIRYYTDDEQTLCVTVLNGVSGIFPVRFNDGTYEADAEGMVFVDGDGYIYWYNIGLQNVRKSFLIGDDALLYTVKTENRRIIHILAGKYGAVCSWDFGETIVKICSEYLYGACVCANRFFFSSEPSVVKYSAKFRPFDTAESLEEGGELYLPSELGRVVGMQSIGNELYVFCEYGIRRFKIAASAKEFESSEVDYGGGEIYKGSIVRVEGYIVFLAASGAYRLKGDKTERICKEFDLQMADTALPCRSGAFEGAAIVEYSKKKPTGGSERIFAVLPVDGEDGYLTEVRNGVAGGNCCMIEGNIYRFSKAGDTRWLTKEARFTTAETDFGIKKQKTVTGIAFTGVGEVKIVVRSELGSREYTVVMKNGRGEVKFHHKGIAFAFDIKPKEGAELSGMAVEYIYAA